MRDLHYLITVADLGHFGRAAEARHVSQSTLSIQIKKLEDELGVQLLERTNKQVLPTQAGRAIIEAARRTLKEADHMRALAANARDPFTGELMLGAFPTLAPYLFPLAVPVMRHALPRLQLVLVEEKTQRLVEMLKDGQLDCALLALPIHEEGLEALALFEEPFTLAVPASHKLARKKLVKLDDLAKETMLLLDEGHCLRAQALDVCAEIGLGESRRYRATSLETLRSMVAADAGVTFMPWLARRADGQNIAYVPFANPAPARQIGLVWRSSSPRGELFAALAKKITASAVEVLK